MPRGHKDLERKRASLKAKMFTFTKSTNTALALLEKSSSSASYFQRSTNLQGKPVLLDRKGGGADTLAVEMFGLTYNSYVVKWP
jgi:hypothetical protein